MCLYSPATGAEGEMPIYTFKLSDDGEGVADDTGVILPDAAIAFRYACDVVAELMNRREQATRTWRLDVYEDARKVFEIPFASLDATLDHLPPDQRQAVKVIAEQRRWLKDAVSDAKVTSREAQALVARSRGKPYLAAERGQKTIRDDPDDRFR
jgi:hypothetical protein